MNNVNRKGTSETPEVTYSGLQVVVKALEKRVLFSNALKACFLQVATSLAFISVPIRSQVRQNDLCCPCTVRLSECIGARVGAALLSCLSIESAAFPP